jgi:chitin disaccharide deacetylase
MTTAPLWEVDGPRLAPFTAAADIGLHFALTEVPTLYPVVRRRKDGAPLTFAQVQAAALTGRIDVDAVFEELRLQWQRFRDVAGRAPSHLDSHQHVHQLPGVRRAVLAFLDGLPAGERPYVRTCVERRRTILRRNVNNVRALAFARAGARLARGLRERGVATNDGFSGVYNFVAADYRALFRRFLKDVRERTIVICHPAASDAPGDPIAAARSREYAYLASEQMPADLAEARVRAARFA